MAQKDAFFHQDRDHPHHKHADRHDVEDRCAHATADNKTPPFFTSCLRFVPSLSWQNDRFS